jgi:mono/diheme cytochrome c family protein
MRQQWMKPLVLGWFALWFAAAHAAEPVLTIKSAKGEKKFTRGELLGRPSLREVKVKDPAYGGRVMTYSGVPVAELFKDLAISDEATIVFHCLDGFSAPLERRRLLNTNPADAIAYLAVERATDPWPRLKADKPATPGPFYLVWMNPEKSKISKEEWPFMLSGFEVKASVAETFPLIAPDRSVAEDSFVYRGYKLFVKNCFACHTMNGQGTSNLGPDLNIPYSPIEYLKPELLRLMVRNPQALRKWPGSRMNGFPKESLAEAELEDIISYLKHMAQRR